MTYLVLITELYTHKYTYKYAQMYGLFFFLQGQSHGQKHSIIQKKKIIIIIYIAMYNLIVISNLKIFAFL